MARKPTYKDCPKCREDVEPMVDGEPSKFRLEGKTWLRINLECPLCGHQWAAQIPEDEYDPIQ